MSEERLIGVGDSEIFPSNCGGVTLELEDRRRGINSGVNFKDARLKKPFFAC